MNVQEQQERLGYVRANHQQDKACGDDDDTVSSPVHKKCEDGRMMSVMPTAQQRVCPDLARPLLNSSIGADISGLASSKALTPEEIATVISIPRRLPYTPPSFARQGLRLPISQHHQAPNTCLSRPGM